jgi:hypothetical protein
MNALRKIDRCIVPLPRTAAVLLLCAAPLAVLLAGCAPAGLGRGSIWTNVGGTASWKILGNASFSINTIGEISIAPGLGGAAAVIYNDGGRASGMQFDGTQWVPMASPGFSPNGIWSPSATCDSVGNVYVAFQDQSSGMARVMKYDGVSWASFGSGVISPGTASDTSLALDSADTPYIAFSDSLAVPAGAATVRRCVLGTWGPVGPAGFSGGFLGVGFTSLALDGSGIPYVAYSDGNQGNRITVMKYSAGWAPVGSPGFAGSVAYVSLAINPVTAQPYVGFYDASIGGRVSVMRYDGSAWVLVGSAGLSPGRVDAVSLKLDAAGVPYLAFQDHSSHADTVMKFNGSSWDTLGPAGFTAGGSFPSLAIDSNGNPLLAFQDSSCKATVMSFR